jgi:PAS domain S-box-containing protein
MILGVIRDVSSYKKTEYALIESEKRSRTIVANALIGIATSDVDKKFLNANEAFCKIIGYTEDEL